jgi:hypothetical protein
MIRKDRRSMVDLEKAMRSILALGLLVTLYSSANAATVHPGHRRHAVRPDQSMIYPPYGPAIRHRAAPYNNYSEPYFGASQGYAPGEKQQFLESVMRPD